MRFPTVDTLIMYLHLECHSTTLVKAFPEQFNEIYDFDELLHPLTNRLIYTTLATHFATYNNECSSSSSSSKSKLQYSENVTILSF